MNVFDETTHQAQQVTAADKKLWLKPEVEIISTDTIESGYFHLPHYEGVPTGNYAINHHRYAS
jgi:hypothetical protein